MAEIKGMIYKTMMMTKSLFSEQELSHSGQVEPLPLVSRSAAQRYC
jgi:hypothetical protein